MSRSFWSVMSTPIRESPERRNYFWLEFSALAGLALTAFLLRNAYFHAYLSELPNALIPANDAKMYWDLGRKIYREGWNLPDGRPFYQAPLYPYFLAIFHHLGIHPVEPVLRFQVLMGVVNVLLVYRLARLLFQPAGAVLSALLFAFCPLPLFYETKILPETLGITLFLLFLLRFAGWLENAGVRRLIFSAGLYGSLLLCRPNFMFLLPFLGLFFLQLKPQSPELPIAPENRFQRYWQLVAKLRLQGGGWLFLLVLLLVLSPATLRNRFVGNDWVLICANSGVTLYMGTNDRAEGGLGPVEGLSNEIERQQMESIELASQLANATFTPSQASSFWVRKTLKWIVSHPISFFLLEFKKSLWAFYHHPPAVNYSLHFESQWIPWPARLGWLTWLSLTGTLTGLLLISCKTKKTVLLLWNVIGGYVLLSEIYYASDRFLAATVPAMAILTVWTIQQVFDAVRRHIETHDDGISRLGWISPRRFWIFFSWTILSAGLAANPFLSGNAMKETAWGWYNLGVFYEQTEREDSAMSAYGTALSLQPDAPEVLINLGVLYAKRNDLEESNRLFERALQLVPTHPLARKNLRINYLRQGRESEAEKLTQPEKK